MNLHLRKAERADARFLFELRNEAAVREASFNSAHIPWKTHERWFAGKLCDAQTALFIAEAEGLPAGQVRFEMMSETEAEVNCALVQSFRGKGYGSLILTDASARFLADYPSIARIHAFIKPDNAPSRKSFERAGYRLVGETEHKGHLCTEMIFTREGITGRTSVRL